MKTPKYIDINYFTDKKAEEIKNKGGIILLGRIYDYKDGKLVRRECDKKEVDWKSVTEDYWKIIQDMSNRIKELENELKETKQ